MIISGNFSGNTFLHAAVAFFPIASSVHTSVHWKRLVGLFVISYMLISCIRAIY